ncbi:MAG: ribosomal L7Ae/L30e/S12e/Gadd45 family protein [Clostridia bacterium]|nr:ribosomal L7Ae/L30e/S12e/Gadd45 family protein [Clostridia bacterium]
MDGDLKSQPILIGVRQCSEAVAAGKAASAYVAQDADAPVREPFEALCREKQVPVTYFDTKQQLGRACGIDVGAACAVVLI